MKKRVVIAIMLLHLLAMNLSARNWSEESHNHQTSTIPSTSRYEIVQSELGARVTLKVDKYLGQTYLLVEDSNERLRWQLIEAEKQPNDTYTLGKVNYQVFTSGLGMRFTFLLNVNSGITWQLTEDSIYGMFWAAFE